MPDYTTDPDAALVDPPVLDLITDGENLDAAHLNPGVQQVGDISANYVRYGAKQNVANTFSQTNTFNGTSSFRGLVDLGVQIRYDGSPGLINGALATQTIGPDDDNEWILPVASAAALPHGDIVLRKTTGTVPTSGDWIRLIILADLATFGANWRVKEEGAGAGVYLAHYDNFDADTIQGDNAPCSWITFRYYAGAWRIWDCGPYWAKGDF